MSRLARSLALVCTVAMAAPAAAQAKLSWVQILSPSSAVEDFGLSLVTDEDGARLAVTARTTGSFSNSTGAVFVFELTPAGWVETQELVVPTPGTQHPRDLALHGDRLVVVEELGYGASGLFWVYDADAQGIWSLTAEVPLPSVGEVATVGDTIFIAQGNRVDVWVEDPTALDGWRLDGELTTPAGASVPAYNVDATGDRMIAGTTTGAHVFESDPGATPAWSELAYLGPYPGLGTEGEVGIFGDTALVGDPNFLAGDELLDYGVGHLHQEEAGWSKTKTLFATGLSYAYAETVDVGPDHLIALDSGVVKTGGQAKLYRRVPLAGVDGWKQVGRLGTNALGDYTEVRLAGDQVLVGTPAWSILYPAGHVQVFAVRDPNQFPGSTSYP